MLQRVALVIFLAVLGLAPSPARAADTVASESPLPADAVVVDRIDIVGTPGLPVDTLRSYFDVRLGSAISRTALQEQLLRFRLRLEALAYFEKIDLSLAKGSERGHYVVVATLTAYPPEYAGVDVSTNRSPLNHLFSPSSEMLNAAAFVGTRDIRGTGLMADFEVDRDSFLSREDPYRSTTSVEVGKISLYHPGIANTPFVAGLEIYGGQVKSNLPRPVNSTTGDTAVSTLNNVNSTEELAGAVAMFGRRFGLASVDILASRTGEKETSTGGPPSLAFKSVSNSYALQAFYSEKSHLAIIEPGIDFTYESDLLFVGTPVQIADLTKTYIVNGKHAFTPGVYAVYAQIPGEQEYQLSINYQWVSPRDWVFGVEPFDQIGPKAKPQYGVALTAQYASPSLLIKLSFSGGTLGLDSSQPEAGRGVLP